MNNKEKMKLEIGDIISGEDFFGCGCGQNFVIVPDYTNFDITAYMEGRKVFLKAFNKDCGRITMYNMIDRIKECHKLGKKEFMIKAVKNLRML